MKNITRIFYLLSIFFVNLTNAQQVSVINERSIYTTDVVVIGAGLSGLMAAKTIADAGLNVILVEARDRVGGRAFSVPLGEGVVADLGAGWIINPVHQNMIQLAQKYHIPLYPTYIEGDALVMEHHKIIRVPMDNMSFSLKNPPQHLKPAVEVLSHLVQMSQTLNPRAPWLYPDAVDLDNTTCLEWVKKNYPKLDQQNFQMLERAIEGYIGPLSTTSVLNVLTYAKMSHGFENYFNMREWLRVEGGVGAIATKIANELQNNPHYRLLLNQPVYQINQTDSLVTVNTVRAVIRAKQAIVALPPIVANGIHYLQNGQHFVPSAGALNMNQRIPMTPGFKAAFVYAKPFWRLKKLSGHVVSQTEPIGVVWDASPQNAKRGCLILLTNPYGSSPSLSELSPREREQLLVNSLVKFFGEDARHYLHYAEQIWDENTFSLGSVGVPGISAWVSYGQYLRKPMGRIHWASSERATESWAQMNGAVVSGIQAGKEVIATVVH